MTLRKLKGLETCSTKGSHRCQNLFKIALTSRDLWLQAYANICANRGATTKGVDGTSLDGHSLERVETLIQLMKDNEYYPVPSRRVYIPKPNGKKRPLGIPSGADKLVQEVWRILLETIYEPVFSEYSHGFRPKRSCHTALTHISKVWTGTKWFIEFDIKGYFDNIDHQILVSVLEKRIDDKKFISIIKRMLKAGYMEEWTFHKTYSGTPQGGVVSPILANIYLHELDVFMETICSTNSFGKSRTDNLEYRRIENSRNYQRRKIDTAKEEGRNDEVTERLATLKLLEKKQLEMPSKDQYDPNYRRLRYCRYADDFVLGYIGSKSEANDISMEIEQFLRKELNLEISKEKSGVRHAATEGCLFLGYKVYIRSTDKTIWYTISGVRCKRRSMNQVVTLSIPEEKKRNFAEKNRYGNYNVPRADHRPELLNQSDVEILLQFNAELRGFAQYYALANNAKGELSRICSLGTLCLLKTLAAKHQSSIRKTYRKMMHGHVRGIVFKGKLYEIWTLKDLKRPTVSNPDLIPVTAKYRNRTEITERLLARCCEYCGTKEGPFEVHHVRKLKDIKDGKEPWQKLMIARNRKTLVVCSKCHDLLHAGKLPDVRYESKGKVESRMP